MTLPVPARTDPAADAALHIRTLAEAIEARLSTTYIVRAFDTGVQTANADGSITAGTVPGMRTIAGAVSTGCFLAANQATGNDGLYMPFPVRDPSTNADLWFRCFNPPTNTTNVGKPQRVRGICWGPAITATADDKAADKDPIWPEPDPEIAERQRQQVAEFNAVTAAAQQLGAVAGQAVPLIPERPGVAPAALPPGSLFPAGKTAHGLRYPGTDEPLWRTAAAITNLADDIGAALGGQPLGLHLATFRGGVTLKGGGSGVGYIQQRFPELSVVRGAVCTAYDFTGGFPESRFFAHVTPGDYAWAPPGPDAFIYPRLNTPAPGFNWPGGMNPGNYMGVNILAWGDPA